MTRPLSDAAAASTDTGRTEAPAVERREPVWPGLTAAGLPTRVPRRGDEEAIREAFIQSWEAEPSSPTPLTRKPFTPTYLTEPPRPRPSWERLDPAALLGTPSGRGDSDTTETKRAPESATGATASDTRQDASAESGRSGPAATLASGTAAEPREPAEPPEPKEPPRPPEPPEPKEPPRPVEPP
ncbi:MAG: hypothetical protein IRY85_20255, partial [Micromonosporaceae bacterium]|nr:hypothetical protein [Micromonosporaceae bacterium]